MKRHKTNIKRKVIGSYIRLAGVVVAVIGLVLLGRWLPSLMVAKAQSVTTPIEQSGLTPLWREDFTNGKMDRMQYSWAKGNNAALASKIIPGMAYLGKDGGTVQVEQELFNFKSDTSPWPHTLEFDVFSPQNGRGRTSIRPRIGGDFVHMNFALPGDATKVNFRFGAEPQYAYNELTGPTQGWAHIVASYEQVLVDGVLQGHYVIAVNDEIREYQGPSKITDYNAYWTATPNAVEWNIEHNSTDVVFGKYIANIRAYQEFIPLAEMNTRVAGVDTYRLALADPKNYSGPSKVFQNHKTLTQDGPNPLMYTETTGPLTIEFDGSLSSAWTKITSYVWDFGDGSTGVGKVVSHIYATAGMYPVTLSVTAAAGTDSYTLPVNVFDVAESSPNPTPTPSESPLPTSTPIPTPTPAATPDPTPSSVSINPVADTYVNSNSANKNFGTVAELQINGGTPTKISYLKFDIPNGLTITSAKLRLQVVKGSAVTETVKGVSNTSWSETGINYSNKPALENTITTIPRTIANTWIDLDVSSYVIGKSGQTVAFGIDTTSSDSLNFSSRESANKPILEIQY